MTQIGQILRRQEGFTKAFRKTMCRRFVVQKGRGAETALEQYILGLL